MKIFNIASDLAASNLQAGQSVLTQGLNTPGDQKGSLFYIAPPQVAGEGDITLVNGNVALFQGFVEDHDHTESDITDLDKYTQAEVDAKTDNKQWANTGVYNGGLITANGTVSIDIAAGTGVIVGTNDVINPTITEVSWDNKVSVPLTNISTQRVTLIYLDIAGNVVQRSRKSYSALRSELFLGGISHPNAVIDDIANTVYKTGDTANLVSDLVKLADGSIVYGGTPIENTLNSLSFDIDEIELFIAGVHAQTSNINPNFLIVPGTSPTTFDYLTGTGSAHLIEQTVTDPSIYDAGGLGVVSEIPNPGTNATVNRLYIVGSKFFILLGQIVHVDLLTAVDELHVDTALTVFPELVGFGKLLAYFITTKQATALNDDIDGTILLTTNVGGGGGSGGGGGIPEAPEDGTLYARKDAGWLPASEVIHTHLEADVTDLDKYTVAEVDGIASGLQVNIDGKEDSFAKLTAFNKNFGSSAGTVTEGHDPRLSDNRTPVAHTHIKANITDFSDGDYATFSQGALADTALQNLNSTTIFSLNDVLDLPLVQVGDFLTWNGVTFVPTPSPGGGGDVSSVFGRTGAVVALVGDYSTFYADISHLHLEADISDLDKYTQSQVDSIESGLQGQINGKENSFSKNTGFNKNFGTGSGTVTQGNDSRLSDARVPTAHNHNTSDITAGTLGVSRGGTGVTSSTGSGSTVRSSSPALSGNPTATTQSGGNSSTRIATTAYVQGELGLKVQYHATSAAALSASQGDGGAGLHVAPD